MGVCTGGSSDSRETISIERSLGLSVIASGVTSIVTQVVLLRELLSAFYGNELVLGIVLANWMLLTGAGSILGRYSHPAGSRNTGIVVSLLLVAILPPITVVLFRVLRNIVFPVGGLIGISDILFGSLLLLMPFCLASGFLFTLFASTISDRSGANLIARVYSLEAIGSIAGGLLFSLVMVFFLKAIQSLLIVTLLDCGIALLVARKDMHTALPYIVASVGVLSLLGWAFFNIDDLSKSLLFRGQDVLYYKDTPYGSLVITAQGDQKNFYEDNVLLFSTQDVTTNEESVHYAMVQHPHATNVLLISGGISGMIQEILKYPVERIDYVEVNPWLIEIGKEYTSAFANQKVRVTNQDGRLFVRSTDHRYDVVLINVPEPGTAQLNRFYTLEFFRELKNRLNPGAVVCLSVGSSADYLSGEARAVRSILYNTLRTVYNDILIVPGEKDYFLASERGLDIGITRLIDREKIPTVYVNKYYLDDSLLHQRSEYVKSTLDKTSDLNRDFAPVSYHRQILYWLSQFNFNYGIVIAIVLAIYVMIFRKMNAVDFGIFAGGFAASSIEVILLISFQIIYGYVYQLMGLLVTSFMGGLAVGALFRDRILSRVSMSGYVSLLLGVGVFAAAMPFILMFLQSVAVSYLFVHAVFFLMAFLVAALIGAQFSMASHLQPGTVGRVAGELYGIDLLGSAAGALVVGAYLIPLAGVTLVCFLIAGLSFTGGLISFIGRGHVAGGHA